MKSQGRQDSGYYLNFANKLSTLVVNSFHHTLLCERGLSHHIKKFVITKLERNFPLMFEVEHKDHRLKYLS